MLSFYDAEASVIVRGKAGSEVEFGQRLLLTEQRDGLIVDWQLFSKQETVSDSAALKPAVERIERAFGAPRSLSTDRAFASQQNDAWLKEKDIYNATCPRSPAELQDRLNEPTFALLQTRRSQTEARIGIFKNVFFGQPRRSRRLLNKQHAVNGCVLTHNLWVLARKAIADEQQRKKEAA